jgi:hypothetical protein
MRDDCRSGRPKGRRKEERWSQNTGLDCFLLQQQHLLNLIQTPPQYSQGRGKSRSFARIARRKTEFSVWSRIEKLKISFWFSLFLSAMQCAVQIGFFIESTVLEVRCKNACLSGALLKMFEDVLC